MALRNLRIYTGPEAKQSSTAVLSETTDPNRVRVTLGEILPLLADAFASNRAWLGDFADDEISISSDLNEVLEAYRHFRSPAA
ncbi:MAG: hypothetical protein ACKOEX_04325 [Planctomycetia bacterium]